MPGWPARCCVGLDLVEQALAELDAVIVAACQPWAHQIELLQTIPGVGPKVAETIVAETGADMTRFPTAAHLAAWAGLAPAMNESAGRQTPAGKRHGNKWLTAMLVEAAGSVGRMHGKNYLAVQHARLTKRRGMGRRRWPSRTRSWTRPTTCTSVTSPTATWPSGTDGPRSCRLGRRTMLGPKFSGRPNGAEAGRHSLAAGLVKRLGATGAAKQDDHMLTNRSAPHARVTPVLTVADVRTAVTWYIEVLGFVEHVRIGRGIARSSGSQTGRQ